MGFLGVRNLDRELIGSHRIQEFYDSKNKDIKFVCEKKRTNYFLSNIFLSLHMKSQDSGFQVRDKECPQGPKVTLDSLSLKYLEPE